MINMQDALYLYTTTNFDEELAEHDPPAFSIVPEGTSTDTAEMLKSAALRAARSYDKYQYVKHISILSHDRMLHMVLTDNNGDPVMLPNSKHSGPSYLQPFVNEASLISDFWDKLSEQASVSIIVGWEIKRDWALLVNKAIVYGIPIPEKYKQNPLVRYPTVDNLLDLSMIYLQGVSPAVRRLPELRDALDYWQADEHGTYVGQNLAQQFTLDDWTQGNAPIEMEYTLNGMRAVLRRYCGEDIKHQNMQGVLRVLDGGTRGPQPPNNTPPAAI